MIAIIAILASMLLPALSKARAAALAAKCTSNLKQVNILTALYFNDNDEQMVTYSTVPGLLIHHWLSSLEIYLGEASSDDNTDYTLPQYYCPVSERTVADTYGANNGYAKNYCGYDPLGILGIDESDRVFNMVFPGSGYYFLTNLKLAKRPSESILYCDVSVAPAGAVLYWGAHRYQVGGGVADGWALFGERHSGRGGMAFIDGHVLQVRGDESRQYGIAEYFDASGIPHLPQ